MVLMAPSKDTVPKCSPAQERGDIALAGTWTFNLGVTVWLAMLASILIWNIGEVRPGTIGNTGNYYRISLVAFSAVAGLMALLRNGDRISQAFTGPLVLLGIYGAYAMVSALYVPEYALYSMWKALEVLIDVVAIGAILSYANSYNAAITTYRVIIALYVFLILLYWIEAAIMPSSAFTPYRGILPYAMQGVLPVTNGNGLAFMGALVAFSGFCGISRSAGATSKAVLWCLVALALATLVLGQSRTSLFGFVAALIVYLLFVRRYMLLGVLGVLALAGWLSTSFFELAQTYFMRGQSEELFTSLSGRTQAWQAAWDMFKQSPLTGHGFAAAARLEILGTEGASTLHGAVFDVLVGIGILGLVPWLAAIIWTSVRLLALTGANHPWMQSPAGRGFHAEMLGVLTLVLVRSLTSSGLALHEHVFMLFLSILAYATSLRRAFTTSKVNQRPEPTSRLRANA